MDTNIDLLQIKIDKARASLPKESIQAIDAVNWKAVILSMRAEKGYSYEQLEDLEIETELLLCGILNPEDYPKELEKRMKLPKAEVNVLINEMNEKVFKRIQEELVKNMGGNKTTELEEETLDLDSVKSEKINNINTVNKNSRELEEQPLEISNTPVTPGAPDLSKITPINETKEDPKKNDVLNIHSILMQKLSGSFQIPKTETEHTLNNISKDTNNPAKFVKPTIDPYREPTE